MTKILSGKVVRDQIAEDLKKEISRWSLSRAKPRGSKPKLVIIQVGDIPESNSYINHKIKFGKSIGTAVDHIKLPKNVSQEEINSQLSTLNSQLDVHGIIVQLPIPESLDKDVVIDAIDPKKDVDGLTSVNTKKLFEGLETGLVPATTKGILTLLDYYKIPISGKKVTIVGRSSLVGKPTAIAFLNRDATVTVCHSKTKDLAVETQRADILISAVGKPGLITKNHVHKNQVVIDIGTTVIDNSQSTIDDSQLQPKLVGDVDFDNVSKIVAAITPVPGGIGPMTVASLFQNLLTAYESKK